MEDTKKLRPMSELLYRCSRVASVFGEPAKLATIDILMKE